MKPRFKNAHGLWESKHDAASEPEPRRSTRYRFAWGDKARVRACMERILAWDFERVILSHGDLITRDAKQIVAQAWAKVLR